MTETASVLTVQTRENYAAGSVGHMIGGLCVKVIDEDGRGKLI